MRLIFSSQRWLLAATMFLLVLLPCAGPDAAQARPRGLPPQGVYDECPTSDRAECAMHLRAIAQAGFRVVLNYTFWFGDVADQRAYLQAAQQAHLQIIVPLNALAWRQPDAAVLQKTYPRMGACACRNRDEYLAWATAVTREPATVAAVWGYYIADEVTPAAVADVVALRAAVRALAPTKPVMAVNNWNDAAVNGPLHNSFTWLGLTAYPWGLINQASWVGRVARSLTHFARQRQRLVMVLQAFDWHSYPGDGIPNGFFPSRRQMLATRNQALRYANPQLLLWYSYYDVLRSSQPEQNWRALQAAAFAPRS